MRVTTSRKPGEDALPQPSRLCITCSPHLFLPFPAQIFIPDSSDLPTFKRKTHQRPWRKRAVHAALHHVSIFFGSEAQSGSFPTGQTGVVDTVSLAAGSEILPVAFTISTICCSASIDVIIAAGEEAAEWD